MTTYPNNQYPSVGWEWVDPSIAVWEHNLDLWAHESIQDQITALAWNTTNAISYLSDNKADKSTTYTKTEVDWLVAWASSTPKNKIEIYENATAATATFDTVYSAWTTGVSAGWASYAINNAWSLANIAAWNSYYWAVHFLTNWTAAEGNNARITTLLSTQYMKLNTMSSFEIENRIVFLQNTWEKSQIVRFWLSTSQSILDANTDWVYMEYIQTTWVLSLKSKSAWVTTTVALKTFTDAQAKLFAKVKITYDWTTIKWFVDWVELWSITTNIPTNVNLQYNPYQAHIAVTSVISRTFLDYFYAKFSFNY